MLWTVPSYSPSLVVTRNLAPTKLFLSAMFCCCYPEQPASAIYNTSARSQGPIVLMEGRVGEWSWEQSWHRHPNTRQRQSDEEFFGDCPGSGPEPSCLLLLNLALNKSCAGGAAVLHKFCVLSLAHDPGFGSDAYFEWGKGRGWEALIWGLRSLKNYNISKKNNWRTNVNNKI